jgi:hypothetical protein
VVDEVASQLDVLPTLVNFAGGSGINSTLGRDLLDPAFAGRRYALTVERLEKSPLVGLISRDFYFKTASDGSEQRLYRIDAADPRADVSAELPETTAEMRELALGLYEAARYMRYHNAPEAVAAQRERGGPSVAAGPAPR